VTDVPADLDAAADELYGGLPQDFTGRRDQLAKAVRASGDRDLAAEIKALRRPTVAAWLVDLAVHENVAELQELLDVGERLREAQASLSGDLMRELSAQRQHLERSVLQRVKEIAAQRGQDVAPQAAVEVEETLRAALADPKAALAVASGHLTRALSYAGLGEVDIEAATATPLQEPSKRRQAPRERDRTRARDKDQERDKDRGRGRRGTERPAPADPAKSKAEDDDTQARARELRDAVQQARDRVEKATSARDTATAREEQLEERAQRLHEELQQVRGELAEATKEASHAEREHSRAARALAAAERELARFDN
jgi:hypothetical protein